MSQFLTRPIESTLTGFLSLVFRVVVAAIVLVVVSWLLGILVALAGIALVFKLIWIAFVLWVFILLVQFVVGFFR